MRSLQGPMGGKASGWLKVCRVPTGESNARRSTAKRLQSVRLLSADVVRLQEQVLWWKQRQFQHAAHSMLKNGLPMVEIEGGNKGARCIVGHCTESIGPKFLCSKTNQLPKGCMQGNRARDAT